MHFNQKQMQGMLSTFNLESTILDSITCNMFQCRHYLFLPKILIEKSMLQIETIGFITKLEFDVEKKIYNMYVSINP
jgi:hypothetical protein